MLKSNSSSHTPSVVQANFSQVSDELIFASDIVPGAVESLMTKSCSPRPETASSKSTRQGRKRGRPRIPVEEAVSADRRKTQIRRAQQAYRARKEATAVSLNNRIRRLETVVERFNTTFLSFSDEVLRLGLLAANPDLGQKLHQSMKQCLSLTKQAISLVDDDGDDAYSPALEAEDEGNLDRHPTVELSSHSVLQEERYSPTLQALSYPSQTTQPDSQTPQGYLPLLQQPPLWNTRIAGDSGFTQRLSLACMRTGYACLNNPSPNTEILNPLLTLPLKLVTRQRLLDFLDSSLRMGHASDTPGHLSLPFFTIGGAGLHYVDYRREYMPVNSSVQWGTTDTSIDYGMGDIWFDCYDVEGYLMENGVIPITNLPSTMQPPSLLEPLKSDCKNIGASQLQSTSAENILLNLSTNKIVDERALIRLLSSSFVCLGRAPGFRRVDVERIVMQIGTVY
ncbi:Hypothetical protein PENO1_019040 [Penicillium occitanis (nom. inval.)]|nr:hypothetical protein PENOC_048690 [Penicillium occitanis (nom. inval.)]PCH06084.1 Hypothetical protein PENO1_019040 [Penicillium occitanis (nom. inval.)]